MKLRKALADKYNWARLSLSSPEASAEQLSELQQQMKLQKEEMERQADAARQERVKLQEKLERQREAAAEQEEAHAAQEAERADQLASIRQKLVAVDGVAASASRVAKLEKQMRA